MNMRFFRSRLAQLARDAHEFRLRLSALRRPCSWSYAQCGEDLILRFAFSSLGIYRPTYLDVGAYDPHYLSNTALFHQWGSRGVNIEPNPALYTRFQRQRARDVNLNLGVADHEGFLDFYVMSNPELSTFSRARAENLTREELQIVAIQKVRVEPIDKLLADHFPRQSPDLLCIDAEGCDLEILKSMDFQRHAPLALCVEAVDYQTGRKREDDLTEFLRSQGYFVYADTYINTIFFHESAFARLKTRPMDEKGSSVYKCNFRGNTAYLPAPFTGLSAKR